jgi:REP element-mobilizing transposase RayT
LQGYDYAQAGAYFLTVVANNRRCLFGRIVNGQMRLNKVGLVAQSCWRGISQHFPNVALDAHVIMPNHVHGIIEIGIVGAKYLSPLPELVPRPPSQAVEVVWQRNYYEHIIRDQESMIHLRGYIADNPAQWEADALYVKES